ncbi:MAG: FadR family transcriptional regulator [Chloroflexi bacterium]|nr:FadR family transcriptional regulator [Chloroflexota bacterium]
MTQPARAVVRRRKVSAAVFSRLDPGSGDLAEAAAAQIRDRIEDGHFGHGERLPSERDLADGLGISRAVLRESLRSLESLGYVESSLGRGTFVVDPSDQWRSQRVIEDWLRIHQAALRDLVELRSAIESQAVRGGGQDPRDLARSLRPLITAQAEAIADGRPDDAAEIDITFHLQLASGTPNQPLLALARALIIRARQAAHAVYRVTAYQEGSVRQHRAIVAALARGDRDMAADLLAEHHLSRSDQVASFLERD